MAPKKSSPKKAQPAQPPLSNVSDAALPLAALLKYLTSGAKAPLSMKQAISAAGPLLKKGFNSPAKLARLSQVDLAELGITDEQIRKGIIALANPSSGTRPYRRPPREHDLDKPLPTSAAEMETQADFDFDEIEHEGTLSQKSVLTNRAPVLTAWATVVAERLGFNRQEALSIASAFVSIHSAAAKGAQQREMNDAQPFVDILGRKVPLLSTQSGEWRAIYESANISEPFTGFKYISKAMAQQTGAAVGALRLLAQSFPAEELNQKGLGLYHAFRPDVEGWGQKGEMHLSTILDLRRFLTHKDELTSAGEVKGEADDEFDCLLEDELDVDLSAVP